MTAGGPSRPADLPALPARPARGHKGTFGTVCVVGGQAALPDVMLGGPAFAALGALRVGAGLAVLAIPEPLIAQALAVAPSATGLALPVDHDGQLRPSDVAALLDEQATDLSCLAIGPGLGAGTAQQQIVVRLISQQALPLVVDADAINALATVPGFQGDFKANVVLTPHPGEYARLAKALKIDANPVEESYRERAATELAQRLGCVVVLKGAGTVISDGMTSWINPTGNVALATAGSGDVLTGVIAGLIAQFFKPSLVPRRAASARATPGVEAQVGLTLYDCARWGVYLHGLAADRWAARHGTAGMLATDLLHELPDALAGVRRER